MELFGQVSTVDIEWFGISSLRQGDGCVGAFIDAGATFDALIIVAHCYIFYGNATNRASLCAGSARSAVVLVDDDSHGDTILSKAGNAFLY